MGSDAMENALTSAYKCYCKLSHDLTSVASSEVPICNYELLIGTQAYLMDVIDEHLTALKDLYVRTSKWYNSDDEGSAKSLTKIMSDLYETVTGYTQQESTAFTNPQKVDVRMLFDYERYMNDFLPRVIELLVHTEHTNSCRFVQSSIYEEIRKSTIAVCSNMSDVIEQIKCPSGKDHIGDRRFGLIVHEKQWVFNIQEIQEQKNRAMAKQAAEDERRRLEARKLALKHRSDCINTVLNQLVCEDVTGFKSRWIRDLKTDDEFDLAEAVWKLIATYDEYAVQNANVLPTRAVTALVSGTYSCIFHIGESDKEMPIKYLIGLMRFFGDYLTVEDLDTHDMYSYTTQDVNYLQTFAGAHSGTMRIAVYIRAK